MALSTKLGLEVPEGALALTQTEALNYQRSVVEDWPILTDKQVTKIFLKYGSELAVGTTLASSVTIFDYFRRALNVQKKIYTLLFSPTLFLPAYISASFTETLVTQNTLLMRLKCPVCNQIKFALVQCYCGMLFPAVYGFSTFTLISYFKGIYTWKKETKDPRLFWKKVYEVGKGGTRSYQIAGLLQSVLILSLPYMQAKELLKISEQLNEAGDDES